jgi:hypothetical protein
MDVRVIQTGYYIDQLRTRIALSEIVKADHAAAIALGVESRTKCT